MKPGQSLPNGASSKVETVVYWDRILLVALGVLLVGVIIGIVLYRSADDAIEAEDIQAELRTSDSSLVVEPNATQAAAAPDAEVDALEAGTASNVPDQPLPAPDADSPEALGEISEPVEQDALLPPVLPEEPAPDLTVEASAPAIAIDNQESEQPFELAPVRYENDSQHVARIQLVENLLNYEPGRRVTQGVPTRGEEIAKVFLFTELVGLIGKTVYHDWYQGDQRVARIRIQPGISPMRASSSKRFNRYMTGDWRAEVVHESGEVLATVFFPVFEEASGTP